jgi:hypothetical protein
MALVNFGGFLTGDSAELEGTSGAVGVQSTVSETGGYALRANPTTTGTGFASVRALDAQGRQSTTSVNATHYTSFRFRVDTLPASGDEPICLMVSGISGVKLEVRINAAGRLAVYNTSVALVATGATVLATGTWYTIGVLSSTGNPSPYELRINGVTELSGSANQGTGNHSGARFGKTNNRNGNSVDFYYDRYVIDTAAFVFGSVGVCIPDANGTPMQWTAGTGASDYTQINNIPTTTGTRVASTGTAGEVARFGFQSLATAGIAGSVLAVRAVGLIAQNGADTNAWNLRLVSGGSTLNTTAFDAAGATLHLIAETDPATGAAWTGAAVDAVEAGAVEANAVVTRLTDLFLMVLYTPSSGRLLPRMIQDGLYVGAQL